MCACVRACVRACVCVCVCLSFCLSVCTRAYQRVTATRWSEEEGGTVGWGGGGGVEVSERDGGAKKPVHNRTWVTGNVNDISPK